jgi:ubiquinone/menaquinone biosynthesis C-methylase UbiE
MAPGFFPGFARRADSHRLSVSMTGVKMGDSVVFIGCANGDRLAAAAAKVGLSGRAVAIVPDDPAAERARKGAAKLGVLLDVDTAPPTRLPVADASADLVVVDDTERLLDDMPAGHRPAFVREIVRVLRGGGRVVVIGAAPRSGIGALLNRAPAERLFTASGAVNAALVADGFRSVRTLAEREGLVFVEGIKPRTP